MAARRVSLPAADDLFRPTSGDHEDEAAPRVAAVPNDGDGRSGAQRGASARSTQSGEQRSRRTSGRVRHDEKMTVYVTAEELLEIEHTRLALRREHGLAVDRGRLVREALAIVLADLEARGEDSELVRRLIG